MAAGAEQDQPFLHHLLYNPPRPSRQRRCCRLLSIAACARYLAANQGARATIQGNTDERGSREYNIALGQRRADSIKRMMILVGARDNQVETVSYGEEKPRNAGHDENAWAENRRGDILHAGE